MIDNLLEINVKKPMKLWVKIAVLEITPEEAQKINSPLEIEKYYKEKEEQFMYVTAGELVKINEIKLEK